MPAGMAMNGMAMPGMNGTDPESPIILFSQLQTESRHAILDEMGPCEHQSCDQQQAVVAKVNHYNAAQFDRILTAPEFLHSNGYQSLFHGARDTPELLSPPIRTLLSISLRI
jgi:hypothetical protein